MFCSQCGTKLPDDSMFCSQCGARLMTQPDNATASYENQLHMPTDSETSFIYSCLKCGSPLPVDLQKHIIVCPSCNTQNVNPYYSEARDMNLCSVNITYLPFKKPLPNMVVTVGETQETVEIPNGQSGVIRLKPGKYKLKFQVTPMDKQEHDIHVYDSESNINVTCSHGRFFGSDIAIEHIEGIYVNPEMENFRGYGIEQYEDLLRSAGFTNVSIRAAFGPEQEIYEEEEKIINEAEGRKKKKYRGRNAQTVKKIGNVTADGCELFSEEFREKVPRDAAITIIYFEAEE